MTRTRLIALVALVLSVAVAWQLHTRRQNSESERLVLDALRIIRDVANIPQEETKDGLGGFEGAYQFQQIVSDAQHRLEPWLSDTDTRHQRIVAAARDMLSDLDDASRLYLTIHQSGSGSEEQMAQLKVKAGSGLVKTINVTTTVLKEGDLLTSDSKRRVVNYINVAFGKELSELEASKKAGNAQLTFSTMAVLLMKREYEKHK
jgi:hypothetical protein